MCLILSIKIFEELEMWEEIIECHKVMEKFKKAEEIVRKQLELKETPLLWCVLGDLTNDDECYRKSWELSEHHFARAERSLGRSCTKRGDVSH
jgi:hypothetical protein